VTLMAIHSEIGLFFHCNLLILSAPESRIGTDSRPIYERKSIYPANLVSPIVRPKKRFSRA